jgi:hypothetical protein
MPKGAPVDDGIVQYEGKVCASFWSFAIGAGRVTPSRTIFVCEPPSVCTEFAPLVAADMRLDLKTPDQPRLILPDLVRTVETLQLNSSSTSAPITPLSGSSLIVAPSASPAGVGATAAAMVMAILGIFA